VIRVSRADDDRRHRGRVQDPLRRHVGDARAVVLVAHGAERSEQTLIPLVSTDLPDDRRVLSQRRRIRDDVLRARVQIFIRQQSPRDDAVRQQPDARLSTIVHHHLLRPSIEQRVLNLIRRNLRARVHHLLHALRVEIRQRNRADFPRPLQIRQKQRRVDVIFLIVIVPIQLHHPEFPHPYASHRSRHVLLDPRLRHRRLLSPDAAQFRAHDYLIAVFFPVRRLQVLSHQRFARSVAARLRSRVERRHAAVDERREIRRRVVASRAIARAFAAVSAGELPAPLFCVAVGQSPPSSRVAASRRRRRRRLTLTTWDGRSVVPSSGDVERGTALVRARASGGASTRAHAADAASAASARRVSAAAARSSSRDADATTTRARGAGRGVDVGVGVGGARGTARGARSVMADAAVGFGWIRLDSRREVTRRRRARRGLEWRRLTLKRYEEMEKEPRVEDGPVG